MSPDKILHVGKPFIPDRARLNSYLDKACESAILTNDGPLVRELEEKVAEYLGVRHAVCVSSGTVGLQIAAKALGWSNDEAVVMPSWTFPATATALSWIGFDPIFLDADKNTHLIPAAIYPFTAVLGAHTWGQECLAMSGGGRSGDGLVATIYDAAHAFAPGWGQHGGAEVFSFHATKFFHTVEGGCITTASDDIAARCRRLRNFGYEDGEIVDTGINGKMSEVHAAWGLAMLPELPEIILANERNYNLYRAWLPGYEFVEHQSGSNYQYVVMQMQHRDAVMSILHDEGILARRYFYPGVHRLAPYDSHASLPNTEYLSDHTLVLPNGPSVDDRDIERICRIIRGAALPIDKNIPSHANLPVNR